VKINQSISLPRLLQSVTSFTLPKLVSKFMYYYCMPVSSVASRYTWDLLTPVSMFFSENTNNTQRQILRCFHCSHLELSACSPPSLITDCGNVCQTLEGLLVFLPELLNLRTVYFALYKSINQSINNF